MKEAAKRVSRDFFSSSGFYGGISGAVFGEILSGRFDPVRFAGSAALVSSVIFLMNVLALWIAMKITRRQGDKNRTDKTPD